MTLSRFFGDPLITRAGPSFSSIPASGVNEGYKSPSASNSPVGYSESYGAPVPFNSPSAQGSPTRPPGLAQKYASSPPSNGFMSDRDARLLAQQTANPFYCPPGSTSTSLPGSSMDLDVSANQPRQSSPLKRTTRARSGSPESSPQPYHLHLQPSAPTDRKIRPMRPLRATQSLPAPPPQPLVTPEPVDGYGSSAGGWGEVCAEEDEDAEMGGVELAPPLMAGGGEQHWQGGSISEWARSEDF